MSTTCLLERIKAFVFQMGVKFKVIFISRGDLSNNCLIAVVSWSRSFIEVITVIL